MEKGADKATEILRRHMREMILADEGIHDVLILRVY